MPSVHSKMIMIGFVIALLFRWASLDCNLDEVVSEICGHQSDLIRNKPPKDVYKEIAGTVWFPHHTGVNGSIYKYIHHELAFPVSEARNIHFKYDEETNYHRRRRACKISIHNRICHFLHSMREGDKVWAAAQNNNWNETSVSADFFHVCMHFVDTFESRWIRPMTEEQKDDMGFPGYPTAYQAADGSHFHRRKSKRLPSDL